MRTNFHVVKMEDEHFRGVGLHDVVSIYHMPVYLKVAHLCPVLYALLTGRYDYSGGLCER